MTRSVFLSSKDIPPQERLIFALDVPNHGQARHLVDLLGETVRFYKLGLELFMSGSYFEFMEWIIEEANKKVFVDLKFFDVPETVHHAVASLAGHGATFASVHGNEPMLEAAVKAKGAVKILAVTVLTSLDQTDLEDLGFRTDVETLVLSRARRALQIGCDGVISSGMEAPRLRSKLGDKFLIVSPGIRPVENRMVDDQKRVVSVEEAFLGGADYIVVGRPIRDAPDPTAAAAQIQRTIAAIFSGI